MVTNNARLRTPLNNRPISKLCFKSHNHLCMYDSNTKISKLAFIELHSRKPFTNCTQLVEGVQSLSICTVFLFTKLTRNILKAKGKK